MKKFAACMILLALSGPITSRADEPDHNRSPYHVDLALDLGVSCTSLLLMGVPRLLVDEWVRTECGLDCDKNDVNPFDRQVIGNSNETANILSDVGDGITWSLPFVLGAIDVLASDPVDGWKGYGKDAVIMFETLSLTLSFNGLLGFIVRRPRPKAYDLSQPDEVRLSGDAAMSFPSGHTSTAFALATAYSYTFNLRHPDSPMIIPIWIGTHAAAAATGILRTYAGDHFWTDVLVGAALGVGMGLLIPYMHRCGDEHDNSRFTIMPLVTPDGGLGAAITFR
jgi:hypothetical protein